MHSELCHRWRRTPLLLLLAAALFALGCTQEISSPSSVQVPSSSVTAPPGLSAALAAQEHHTNGLLRHAGVIGTAVGLDVGGRAVVRVFTRTDQVRGLPATLDGVPLAVVVTGEIRALPASPAAPEASVASRPWDAFSRPVPIGVSTGNEGACSSGTIAARVKAGRNVYALSNNHIYALENLAAPGSRILQPGRYDLNCASGVDAVLGPLTRYVPIVFSRTANNVIDAAIAATTTSLLDRATPRGGYGTPASAPVTPALGHPVQKYGRTSGLTTGWVDGINATVMVTYHTGVARFVGQVLVDGRGTFSRAGDSGSLIVTTEGRHPVGLLFAGTESGYTFANPIEAVLKAFKISIDGT